MGLFDHVRCLYPLPEGAPTEGYQTKDTDEQYLGLYEIAADGRLRHEVCHIEDRSDKSAPEGSLLRLAGMMTRVSDSWEDVPFHGALHFYGGFEMEWIFVALYDHGTL